VFTPVVSNSFVSEIFAHVYTEYVRIGLTADVLLVSLVSKLRYLFHHAVSFRHPDILAALLAWCCTSDCTAPLLVMFVHKYLNFVTCSIVSLCISNLHRSDPLLLVPLFYVMIL
jgi:hypothetical protein